MATGHKILCRQIKNQNLSVASSEVHVHRNTRYQGVSALLVCKIGVDIGA